MTGWDELLATAVVGTARRPLPPLGGAGEMGDLLGQLERERPERALLQAAAVLSAARRAGQPLLAAGPPPAAPQLDGEPPLCGRRFDRLLGELLAADRVGLVEEALRLLLAHGRRLAPERLPALLDLARARPARRDLVEQTLAARGRWLAEQSPDWAFVVPVPPEAWATGTRDERLRLLERLRRDDPDRARELVASTWREDDGRDRAAFLEQLAVNLAPADEPWLEAALDDRRREVRAAAAALLARLPASALQERMLGRLRRLVRISDGALRCELPEWDDALARDGLERRPPRGAGERAFWLYQLVGRAPLTRLGEELGLPPEGLVEALARAEDGEALLRAAAAAALLPGQARLAEALLRGGHVRPPGPLARALPAERREPVALALLADGDPDALAAAVAVAGDEPWSERLARAVLDRLRALAPAQRLDGQVLVRLALSAPPGLADEAARSWPLEGRGRRLVAGQVDELLATLRLRAELHDAITEDGWNATT